MTNYPENLFRYRSAKTEYFWDELEQAILYQRIFLASAATLNDPFELRPIYVQSDLRDVIADLKATHGEKPIISRERYSELSGRPVNRQEYKAKARILKPGVQSAKIELATSKKTFEDIPSNSRVACFSTNENNIPMWAHYSDNHAGVCLKYRFRHDLYSEADLGPLEVRYQSERPVIDTLGLRAFTKRTKMSQASDDKGMAVFEAIFLTKSTHWEYEQEYRLVDSYEAAPGYRHVNCLEVESVSFGINAGDDQIERCQELFGDKVEIYKCEVSSSDFLIDKIKLM